MISRILLRALTINDLPKTHIWHNQEEIIDMYSGHPFPVNVEMEQKWYDRILMSNYPTTVFGIEIAESSMLIGISVLKEIDLLNRSAETAIYIGDRSQRSKGYSKEALTQTLDFGFNSLGLNRIWLRVRTDNMKAIKLYQQSGLRSEGVLRDAVFKNGGFQSVSILSILRKEYLLMNYNSHSTEVTLQQDSEET